MLAGEVVDVVHLGVVLREWSGHGDAAVLGTDGDVIWRGTEDVGALGAGESYTTTRQVDLSFADALAVQNAGGWITVQTSVETADRTVTVTDERQVA